MRVLYPAAPAAAMVRRYLIASSPVAKKRSSRIVPGPAPENAVAVPDFQTLMLPTLRLTAAGPIRTGDLVVQLADAFGLSAEDREEMLPGGRQRRMANRCHWAVAYLGKAGLISRVRRGEYEATPAVGRCCRRPPTASRYPSCWIAILAFAHFGVWTAFRPPQPDRRWMPRPRPGQHRRKP